MLQEMERQKDGGDGGEAERQQRCSRQAGRQAGSVKAVRMRHEGGRKGWRQDRSASHAPAARPPPARVPCCRLPFVSTRVAEKRTERLREEYSSFEREKQRRVFCCRKEGVR